MRTVAHTWFNKPPLGTGIDYSAQFPPSAAFLLNEQGGTLVGDIIGRNSGTVSDVTAWTTGKYGSAISTAAGTKSITVASPTAAVNNMITGQAATWLAWIKPSTVGAAQTAFLFKGNGSNAGWYFSMLNAQLRFVSYGGLANSNATSDTNNVLTTTAWYQVAATLNGPSTTGTNFKLFINGAEVSGYSTQSGASGTVVADAANSLLIGAGASGVANYQGLIDHCAFWPTVALSAGQIQELYINPFAYWLPPALKRYSIFGQTSKTGDPIIVFGG